MMRLVIVAGLLLAACKKGDSGPPCAKVVDHMQLLMKQMMPGHDPAALGDRDQMIAQCKQRKMPAKVRQCIVDAKSFNDLAACRKKDPKSTTTTPTPPPTKPVPAAPSQPEAGSGSDAGNAAGSNGPGSNAAGSAATGSAGSAAR